MLKKIRLFIVVITLSIVGFNFVYGNDDDTASRENKEIYKAGFFGKVKELGEISAVMDIIAENFVITDETKQDQVTKEKLLQGALKGMMEALDDPHSVYLAKKELEDFTEDLSGEFVGVGMQITKAPNKALEVVSPIEDTPAFKAGLKPQDKIIEISGKSTLKLTTNECVKMLRGKKGTKVKIKVVREGIEKPFEVTLVRELVHLKYVKSKMLKDKFGYVRLTQFGENVADDVEAAVRKLKKDGMEGMILDLRFNPGGSLQEAIKISSLFIKEGKVVSIKYKDSKEHVQNAIGNYVGDFPLVVLVNKGSASASEIVAGAIKDRGRGSLVGEKTFGKGSVQNIIKLPNGGAIKLTIAKYFTPNGICIHTKGIEPDVEVKLKDEKAILLLSETITNVNEKAVEKNTINKLKSVKDKGIDIKNADKDDQLNTAIGVLKVMQREKKSK